MCKTVLPFSFDSSFWHVTDETLVRPSESHCPQRPQGSDRTVRQSTVISRTHTSHYFRTHRSNKIILSLPGKSFCPFSALKIRALSRSYSNVPLELFPHSLGQKEPYVSCVLCNSAKSSAWHVFEGDTPASSTPRTRTHLICVSHCLFQKLYLALKGVYLTSFSCDLLLHPHCHFHSWGGKKEANRLHF